MGYPDVLVSIDENLIVIADFIILLHESVVCLVVLLIEGHCILACLDGFDVLVQFGVAETQVEVCVFIVRVLLLHVLFVVLSCLLELPLLEGLVSLLLQRWHANIIMVGKLT